MEIYQRTSIWKLYLIFFGAIILILPIYFANKLAHNLALRERNNVSLFIRTLEELNKSTNIDEDVTYPLDIQSSLGKEIHVVTQNRNDVYQFWNYGEHPDTLAILKRLEKSQQFIETAEYPKIYYEYPAIVKFIQYIPWIQFVLLVIYALIGYSVFNLSRKEEQNRVWVGMAKETAHQLGTPISGMMGWIEQLKNKEEPHFSDVQIIEFIEQDIVKLQQVSDRFSKIGSKASLHKESIRSVLMEAEQYIKPRASKKIEFQFPKMEDQDYFVNINKNLFSWVLENLLRNSLDAMEDKGKITVAYALHGNIIALEVSDTGKGISPGKFKTIFRPGFTTKERGWGLGLSLSKRIIENYHKGKIYVKESTPFVKTTFVIELEIEH